MDLKESALIHELHRRVSNRTFHELDVFGLLIALRSHSLPNSPLREVGDFVAHREKDRGLLKAYVQHVVDYCDALQTGKAASLEIKPVYTPTEFAESLNATLATCGLGALSLDLTNDVLVCVLSLLQGVRLFDKNAELGILLLARFGGDLHLAAAIPRVGSKQVTVVFPALIVPNRYCTAVSDFSPFPSLVEVRCLHGTLRLFINGTVAA